MAIVSDPPPPPDPAAPPAPGYRRTLGFLWWLPLVVALVVGLIVYAASASAADVYVASTLLLTPEESVVEPQAYADLAHERSILRETIRSLRIPTTEPELSAALDVEVRGRIVEIHARATQPAGAQILLQTLATQIAFQAPDLLGAEPPQIVRAARVPSGPEGNGEARNTGLGVGLGMLGGIVLAGLVARRELRLRNASEFERLTGWPVLGVTPLRSGSPSDQTQANPARVGLDTTYRDLARLVDQVRVEAGVRSLVVTAAAPGQGATMLASGLAAALSREGLEVTLVDANLRDPGVHRSFGLPNDRGLADLIARAPIAPQPIEQSAVIVAPVAPPLRVITSGMLPPSPERLLDSERVAALIEGLSPASDITLINAPSLSDAPEAAVLAARSDATLVAVASDGIYSDALQGAVELINAAGGPQPGLVVTAAKPPVIEAFQAALAAAEMLAGPPDLPLVEAEPADRPPPALDDAARDTIDDPADDRVGAIEGDTLSNESVRPDPTPQEGGEPAIETTLWAPPAAEVAPPERDDDGLPPPR